MGKKGESMKDLLLEVNIEKAITDLLKVQQEKNKAIMRIKELNEEIKRLREILNA